MFSKERTGCLLIVYVMFSLVVWRLLSDADKNYDLEKTLPAPLSPYPLSRPWSFRHLQWRSQWCCAHLHVAWFSASRDALGNKDSPSPCPKEENCIMRVFLKKNCTFYLTSLFSFMPTMVKMVKWLLKTHSFTTGRVTQVAPQMYLELFCIFVSLPGPVSESRLIPCVGMALSGPGVERMQGISMAALKAEAPVRATLQWD